MPNFCRDVLLPGAAAIGLLLAFAIGPAEAYDEPAESDSGIEPPCERERRIGKFTLTRCD